jgi:gliding motility-associated-like protein
VQNFQLAVYNRWGEIVFQTTEPSKCWDGVHKGKVEGSATFVYVITADTQCGKVFRKGYVRPSIKQQNKGSTRLPLFLFNTV